MPEDSQVNAAEIARIVGVSRAAVSNWRRRYLDFPKPVGGTPTSPAFSWAEVETWLKANNKLSRSVEPRPEPEETTSQAPWDDERLAEAMAALLPELTGGLILDPACGAGRTLVAAAGTVAADTAFAAQDHDGAAVEATRDALENVFRVPRTLRQGDPFTSDALSEFRAAADAVLCIPPISPSGSTRPIPLDELTLDPRWEFGLPAATDPVGSWAQICYSYLKPGGIAVIALPAVHATRPAGRRIRVELLRKGALETVIALPHRYALKVGGGVQIWVLRRPIGAPEHKIRMIDLAESDDLPASRDGWRAVYDDPLRSRVVPAIDLLDDEVALAPARHVQAPAADLLQRHREITKRLESLLHKTIAEAPAFSPTARQGDFPLASVAELQRAGALEILNRDSGVKLHDIVICVNSTPVVIDSHDRIIEVQRNGGISEIIRCDPQQLDPFFVAGFLQASSASRSSTKTGSSSRSTVRKTRIFRIPLAEQHRYGAAFRHLEEWSRLLRQTWETGREAASWALHGLTTGALDPDQAVERDAITPPGDSGALES